MIDIKINPITKFSDLAFVLQYCDELLIEHQIYLMQKKIESAFASFEKIYIIRKKHMQIAYDSLIPQYIKHMNKVPEGGKPNYFLRETNLIQRLLDAKIRYLGGLMLNGNNQNLDIVNLFQDYVSLKDLIDHHDAREKAFLFPVWIIICNILSTLIF